MHRPTRRPKRYKRPPSSLYLSTDISSSSRAVNRLTTSTDLLEAHAEDPNDVRHRRGTSLDAIRGATLVALVVVTIILYFTLWELERSSFALLPSRNPLVVLSNDTVSRSVSLELEASMPAVATNPQASNVEQWNTPLNRDATPSKKPDRPTRNAWPPLITRVPDEQNENPNEIDNELLDRVIQAIDCDVWCINSSL
ncbi:hypothetical protein PAXINDRAFT_16235 [Paxillus involutus ATCC 200175]|uniref:Unplaced genomic scaffold PAXINscaffold_74, whole genome shotgun sequence n=1 Tax=Paxillus involutus ATCC 200175 TaxID=664439 RepID=A0A0C9TSG8_PAXIN|nr:hypothetical protein PAXINDRAFT_16235 [Paxillus involutus ATCC 200175]